jgi:hypothetical protein
MEEREDGYEAASRVDLWVESLIVSAKLHARVNKERYTYMFRFNEFASTSNVVAENITTIQWRKIVLYASAPSLAHG